MVLEAKQNPPNLKFLFLAWPRASYPVSLCSLSRKTAPQSPAASQLSLWVAVTSQVNHCPVFIIYLIFSLSLHLWLVAKSSISNSENRTWNLGLFLQRRCWVIWCPPEVDAGKCNYYPRCRFFTFEHKPPVHFPH